MNNNIKLKDLVWKEIDKKTELDKLELKWRELSYDADISTIGFIFDNAEQIAKEKAEILNKQIEYTKQDIIDMFVEAGFRYLPDYTRLLFHYDKLIFGIELSDDEHNELQFIINRNNRDSIESIYISLNNHKSIEFYYNKFREILEFEVGNEN